MSTERECLVVSMSRTGRPVIGVGGGAYTNTFTSRYVLDKNTLKLKKAIFVRRKGDLSCSTGQALVPICVGDYVCIFKGALPADDVENKDVAEKCYKVTEIDGTFLYMEETSSLPPIPKSVRKGCNIYHNRDGGYFCVVPEKLLDDEFYSRMIDGNREESAQSDK